MWTRPWQWLVQYWRIAYGAMWEWNEDKVPRMAAALAFYTIFALTPTVLISIGIGGLFYPRDEVLQHVLDEARFLVGNAGVDAVELLIRNAPERTTSMWVTLVGFVTMFFAATGAFTELKDALDTIWEVRPRPGLGVLEMIRDRFLSFAMVLVIGFLLLVSLIVSASISALSGTALSFVSNEVLLLRGTHFVVSMGTITLLFALMYRVLPDAEVRWDDVWLGAVTAATLFALGKGLFGIYLGHSTLASSYGAAGSLVIVVVWVYYSALILLFGAEMTQVQARLRGHEVVPTAVAVHVVESKRLQEGIPHQAAIDASLRAAQSDAPVVPSNGATHESQRPPGAKLPADD
jgi:membrane protein